jgi:methylmalonyl-CoA decarboxylase
MTGQVRTREEGGVCTITLENEGKRNAISYPMMDELIEVLDSLDAAEDDRVVVLRGAGEKAVSAGFDLSQERRPEDDSWDRMTAALADHDYPTIAMLDGAVYGGAVHLAATCDVRVGRTGIRIGIPPAKLGIVYPPDAIERLVAIVGPAKTKELLFTGEPMDAETAKEAGFLNHLVAPDELEPFVSGMAETIAGNAPLSLRGMKEIVDAVVQAGTLPAEDRERAEALRRESFGSRDYREGTAAFAEDREPEFEGR